jgi:peptide deformylase
MFSVLLSMTLLLARAEPICSCHIQSEQIQQIIDQMMDTAQKASLPGLSAPQIGIQKRIILIDLAATEGEPQIEAFINPEILWKNEEVPRAQKIFLRAYDQKGNIIAQEFEGYTAYLFQREIDSLDGVH